MLEVTETNFQKEVLDASLPVLVDFWAPWCGPCRAIASQVKQLAEEYEGTLKVCKCNTDNTPNIAAKYGISSIPTLFLFKDGEIVETLVGAVPKKRIEDKIKPHLE